MGDARAAVILSGLDALLLDTSQLEIYSAPIGRRLLHQDPVNGAEHYLIRYPAGLEAASHTHTAAHTIVVLQGQLVANGRVVGPHAYVHFPAGTEMHHAPAGDEGCLFVTIFDGPFDVCPVPTPGG